ncbi:hypothetical protein HTZ84_22355 [Haloterrigena sp. SYSU A558-1]|uniref:Uncharacterized protein n=1 Tax=Haloterrigena gelatinilytica TaxID=2741724 RepID=A0ABX2LFI1_9EURY|nr:hypothetical protein [Haloterrigena gelatinilytica]NUC75010.1 hypothetical protein [Haloterrigena gelatinilytica]
MATDTDGPPGPLSEFGETRVSEAARERAERIDAQTSTWCYYLSLSTGLCSLVAWLAAVVGVVAIAYAFLSSGTTSVDWWNPILNAAIGAALARLSEYFENPDMEDLV